MELRRRTPATSRAFINTRRAKFKDPRVRQALGLAFDFEWMNRQMMYNAYTRVRGFFNASDFEAKGMPGRGAGGSLPKRTCLKKCSPKKRRCRRPEPAGQPARQPAQGARPGRRPAGPTATARCVTPRASRSPSSTSIAAAASGWSRLLPGARQARHRRRVSPRRLRAHPQAARRVRFRHLHGSHSGQRVAGAELLDRFGSQSADTEGSSNLMGIKDRRSTRSSISRCLRARARSSSRGCARSTGCCATTTSSSRSGMRAPSASRTAPGSSSNRR